MDKRVAARHFAQTRPLPAKRRYAPARGRRYREPGPNSRPANSLVPFLRIILPRTRLRLCCHRQTGLLETMANRRDHHSVSESVCLQTSYRSTEPRNAVSDCLCRDDSILAEQRAPDLMEHDAGGDLLRLLYHFAGFQHNRCQSNSRPSSVPSARMKALRSSTGRLKATSNGTPFLTR